MLMDYQNLTVLLRDGVDRAGRLLPVEDLLLLLLIVPLVVVLLRGVI